MSFCWFCCSVAEIERNIAHLQIYFKRFVNEKLLLIISCKDNLLIDTIVQDCSYMYLIFFS